MTSTMPAGSDPAPRPKRRTFSPEYKLRIVAEYDAAPKNGKGAILHRERLYHSHVKEWRAARDAGALEKPVSCSPSSRARSTSIATSCSSDTALDGAWTTCSACSFSTAVSVIRRISLIIRSAVD